MDELPTEVLISILQRVKDQDFLRKTLSVCKRWYEIIANKTFWIEYHNFWRNGLPSKISNYNLPWQYFAEIRHGHRFEQNLLKNGKGALFPAPEFFAALESEGKFQRITHGWYAVRGIFGATVLLQNNQTVDLFEIFQEKSLYKCYMSDYQVQVTIKVYFNYLGRDQDDLAVVLELMDDEFNTFEEFYWETENEKWTKVVLTKYVSLKNVQYLKLRQEIGYGNLFINPDIPSGTSMPRATLKISFPIHQDQVTVRDPDAYWDEEMFDNEEVINTDDVSESEPETFIGEWSESSESSDVDTDEYSDIHDAFEDDLDDDFESEISTDENKESDSEIETEDDDWTDIDTEDEKDYDGFRKTLKFIEEIKEIIYSGPKKQRKNVKISVSYKSKMQR